jgi:hypothetical protein
MEAQPSTPAPKQWEEGESLESITEGLNELAMVGEVEELDDEGDGEVEYMPPRAERELISPSAERNGRESGEL